VYELKKVYAVILGGGKGNRLKSNIPKQFLEIGEKTVLEHTIEKFNENNYIDNIILVMNANYKGIELEKKIINKYEKVIHIVCGGRTRRESTYNGLKIIEDNDSIVLIHDAVRPFVSHKTINRCIKALENYSAVYPAVPSADTLIQTNDSLFVENIPIRKYMMRGQTPQGFRIETIKRAHLLAQEDLKVDEEVTNDCGLVKRYELCKIKIVEGNRENIKITYPEDLVLIRQLLGDK